MFFLGSGETCIRTYKLTEIRDLKNYGNRGGSENFHFQGGLAL